MHKLNFWEMSEVIPPILARLLARLPYQPPLTDAEIASRSGLTIDRVFVIQHMTDWSQVGILEARKFLHGCNIDFCDWRKMNRLRGYIPRPGKKAPTTWKYLRTSPDWETKYKPLMLRLRASRSTTKTK